MNNGNSRGLHVGTNIFIEGVGLAHYESSANGTCNFLAREGSDLVRYSAITGRGVVLGYGGVRLIDDNFLREVVRPGSRGYIQAVEIAKRAKI